LIHLFFAVPDLDYFIASTASAIFGWLLLFPSGGTYRLIFLCTPLVFLITLCGPLRGRDHLFDQFPTFCIYLSTVLVWFESIIGEPTHFSFIGSSTYYSFWIRSENNPHCNHFSYLIKKEKEKKKKKQTFNGGNK
jgi:hypothetical protein